MVNASSGDPLRHVILPSESSMAEFRSVVSQIQTMPEHQYNDILHRIFEALMDGNVFSTNDYLRYQLPMFTGQKKEVLRLTLEKLSSDIVAILHTLDFENVIKRDKGWFSFSFHSLRGNAIVIQHLSDSVTP